MELHKTREGEAALKQSVNQVYLTLRRTRLMQLKSKRIVSVEERPPWNFSAAPRVGRGSVTYPNEYSAYPYELPASDDGQRRHKNPPIGCHSSEQLGTRLRHGFYGQGSTKVGHQHASATLPSNAVGISGLPLVTYRSKATVQWRRGYGESTVPPLSLAFGDMPALAVFLSLVHDVHEQRRASVRQVNVPPAQAQGP